MSTRPWPSCTTTSIVWLECLYWMRSTFLASARGRSLCCRWLLATCYMETQTWARFAWRRPAACFWIDAHPLVCYWQRVPWQRHRKRQHPARTAVQRRNHSKPPRFACIYMKQALQKISASTMGDICPVLKNSRHHVPSSSSMVLTRTCGPRKACPGCHTEQRLTL